MNEQRRNQRVRLTVPPRVRLGQFGLSGSGELESVSLSGLLLRSALALRVGEALGCEFVLFDSPLIDLSAQVVSRIGDRFSVRFQAGPVSGRLIQDAVDRGLAAGQASVLSINDVSGGKVMRIAGGLNGGLRDDFMNALTRIGVERIDLAAVTQIDNAGVALCRLAVEQHGVGIVKPSSCVRAALGPELAGND